MPHNANMLGLISKLATPQITVHQERCAIVRNRNANCLRCAAACTSGCISFDDDELTVSPERCIGCGTCATVCPTCALEAHNPNDAELEGRCLSSLRESGQVRIACSRALAKMHNNKASADEDATGNESEDAIKVECLGRVEESLLVSLAAAGAKEVELIHCDCGECEHVHGWIALQEVCATTKTLLGAWNASLDVKASSVGKPSTVSSATITDVAASESADAVADETAALDSTQAAPASSDETRIVSNNAVSTATSATASTPKCEYAKVMADGTLAHFLPDRRAHLLDSLAAFGQPNDISLETRLWGRVEIDPDKCTSCRMCATFCPTGAIAKFDDADRTFGVEHYPGDCVKCRSCESICFGGALSIHDHVNARDMMDGGMKRFEMKPLEVARGEAHTIWHMAQSLMNTDHVYER